MEWIDIDSAPKDGTQVLLLIAPKWVAAGAWIPGEGGDIRWPWKFVDFTHDGEPFFNGAPHGDQSGGPTHWMPFPAPPKHE